MPVLPRYLDGALAAYSTGHTGRDIHLGYWDDPPGLDTPCSPEAFTAAQARLTRRLLDLAGVPAGSAVLDVACGLGGTLMALGGGTGLNIDVRQLAVCRSLPPPYPHLVAGDACVLPFGSARFDHLFCIEAMFHFASRAAFLAEAARVLRPGGTLTLTDILMAPPGGRAPWPDAKLAEALRQDYGPWPVLWLDQGIWTGHAHMAGLVVEAWQNWTAETLPSYRLIAPETAVDLNAGQGMRWLHANGFMTYAAVKLRLQ